MLFTIVLLIRSTDALKFPPFLFTEGGSIINPPPKDSP